jgi:pyruvate dehydrogenase (quinone)
MEGDPRFDTSQSLPEFPYAAYAELLGLLGIRVAHPGDVPGAWDTALTADRPTLIEAVVDPDVPLLPPFPAGEQKLDSFRAGLAAEGEAGEHARALLDEQAAHEGTSERDRPSQDRLPVPAQVSFTVVRQVGSSGPVEIGTSARRPS